MTDFEQSQLVKYNPAFLSEDALVRGFVVRELDLELLVDTVRDNNTLPNHHVIVVGPRGSGKTTLLRRATIAVKRGSTLGQCWYPLVFAEESYQVTSAGEFWLEAVFQLAEQTGDPALGRTHQQLNREFDDDRLRERALGVLLDFADSVGKRLLLVVENFHMLTAQIGDDAAWKIRHTLQNEHRIMFLASATTRFDAIDKADSAFYELFKIHELQPLGVDECHAVWVARSGKQPPAGSIRPIEILTGGNLRLMTIISRFGAERSFRALLTELMLLVDEHTEYFKSHLDGLPTTERKVYLALAEYWAPATAREIGEIARLDVHKTSALLGRLVRRGAVRTVDLGGTQKRYQLAERLYNVYYLMRRRGSPSDRVKAAVSFMVGYYGPTELVDIAVNIVQMIRSTPDEFFRARDISTQIRRHLAPIWYAVPSSETGRLPGSDRHGTWRLLTEIAGLDDETAEAHCRAMLEREPQNPGGWARLGHFLTWKRGEYAEAEAALHEAVRLDPEYAWAWTRLGLVLGVRGGRARAAEQAARRAVELDPDYAHGWCVLGNVLSMDSERTTEAESAYRKAIDLCSDGHAAWGPLGLLLYELERYDEAEAAFRKGIELRPDDQNVWGLLAGLLHKLERYDEAEAAYRRTVELRPDYEWAWAWLGLLLERDPSRAAEAARAFRRALELCPTNELGWNGLLRLASDGALSFDDVLRSFAELIEAGLPDHSLLNAIAWDVFRFAPSNDFERAATWARRAVEAVPVNSQDRSAYAHTLASLTAAQGKFDEAADAVRIYLTYTGFVAEQIKDTIELFVDFAARGEGSRALQLLRDSPSAEQLETLVVALELDAGIQRPAPHEILEVAKDIQRDIEARRTQLQRRARPL